MIGKNLGMFHTLNPFALSQFQKYFESDESVNPPVKLEPCLSAAGDQIYLTEPLVRNIVFSFIN